LTAALVEILEGTR